jgi:hypothetical protein
MTIRAGEVHRALDCRNRIPLVCAALGASVFEERYQVRRKSVEGPFRRDRKNGELRS